MKREPGTCCRDLVEIERCDVCENGCLGFGISPVLPR